MRLRRHNIEIETHDRIEAAVCRAAGYEVITPGELDNRTLDDISDRELKGIAAQHSLTKEGSLADAKQIRAIIKPYLEP